MAGVQAGLLQRVSERTSLATGYLYLRSDAEPDIDQDGSQLDSSEEIHLGMSVHFYGGFGATAVAPAFS